MGFLKLANIKKTVYYLQRNGIGNTFFAVLERLKTEKEAYSYEAPSKKILEQQRVYCFADSYKISILVPTYETKEEYLRALFASVLGQTYQNYELVIADASRTDVVENVVRTYEDARIVYKRLKENGGISENTNQALMLATGRYVGLLDHDDILAPDALFEMARAIEERKKAGEEPWLLYSDEDKCDGSGSSFFEPHRKTDFDLDLLLSNNYVCHFLVMRTELMKQLRFRKEFDGAQDYDIVLRAVAELLKQNGYEGTNRNCVCHIPKILYHWRSHEESTAANPKSKAYAYEAGKRAIESFLEQMQWKAQVCYTNHVGFYKPVVEDVFQDWGKVAAIGGKLINRRKKVVGGMQRDGKNPFAGMHVRFSGYMHRASMWQTAESLDLRCIKVNPVFYPLFEEITGMKYEESPKDNLFFREKYKKSETEWKKLSEDFSKAVSGDGYRLVFCPDYVYKTERWK